MTENRVDVNCIFPSDYDVALIASAGPMLGEKSDREKRKAEARAAAEASSAERRARKLFLRYLLRDNGNCQLKRELDREENAATGSDAKPEADYLEGEIEALRKRFPEIWSQCVQARFV